MYVCFIFQCLLPTYDFVSTHIFFHCPLLLLQPFFCHFHLALMFMASLSVQRPSYNSSLSVYFTTQLTRIFQVEECYEWKKSNVSFFSPPFKTLLHPITSRHYCNIICSKTVEEKYHFFFLHSVFFLFVFHSISEAQNLLAQNLNKDSTCSCLPFCFPT